MRCSATPSPIAGPAASVIPKAGIPAGQPPTRRRCAVAVRSPPNPPERTATHLAKRPCRNLPVHVATPARPRRDDLDSVDGQRQGVGVPSGLAVRGGELPHVTVAQGLGDP